jgi:anthranilate phosphoribosyltransferase
VANLDQMRLYNSVYQKLGVDYAIENSIDGYDEISLTSNFKVTTNNYEKIFSPNDVKMPLAKPGEIYGGTTKEEAMKIFDSVLENTATESQKNVVIINAAFAIQTLEAGKMQIEECIAKAKESIESGKALATLKKFVEVNC